MRFPKWSHLLPALAAPPILIALALALNSTATDAAGPGRPPAGDLAAFSALAPIDAHVHLYKDDPAFGDLLQHLNMHILDICVIDDRDPYGKGIEPQRGDVLKVVRATHGRAVLCTTFSPYDFEEPGFSRRVIRQLDADFAAGAIAVKIYKVSGITYFPAFDFISMPNTL